MAHEMSDLLQDPVPGKSFMIVNQYDYLHPKLIMQMHTKGVLNDEEADFLLNIRRKYPMLSEKQDRWAADLAQRVMAFQVTGVIE